MENLLAQLNPQQREAVLHPGGPLLILAGAGSGKTRVLTYRLAYLVHRYKEDPRRIMAVTFTNKAAGEMKERVQQLLGHLPNDAWIGTFHSLCSRLLRKEGHHLGIPSNFVVFDESDQLAVVRECLRELDLDEKQFPARQILGVIGRAKDEMVDPPTYARYANGYYEETAAKIYDLYQRKLIAVKALDFDDLIFNTVTLFQQVPQVLEYYQEWFRHILVDEYQDVNYAQYQLVKALAQKHRNITVVGDDDQSIYAFRGADVRIILAFERDYPDAKVITLEQNYRSTQVILDAAWSIISHNQSRKPKRLWTARKGGDLIYLYEALNEQDEGSFVLNRIEDEVHLRGRRWSDCAILYRTNAQSRIFEEACLRRGIPYRIVGGLRFYDRKEIKDALSYLRVLQNPADTLSLRRIINVPPRGIGETTLNRLEAYALRKGCTIFEAMAQVDQVEGIAPHLVSRVRSFYQLMSELRQQSRYRNVPDLLKIVLERTGYMQDLAKLSPSEADDRKRNLEELYGVAYEYQTTSPDPSLSGFLEQVSLMSDVDTYDTSADAVVLMTLHSAKGLEFPVVFLVGMEDGLFPHNRAIVDDNLEEERRLCYVGVTRAMERLYLSYACYRTAYGERVPCTPSRFIQEIPEELFQSSPATLLLHSGFREKLNHRALRREDVEALREMEKREEETSQEKAPFQAGEKVRHPYFGEGIVVRCEGANERIMVTVDFPSAGIKKLSLAHAKLEKV